jgi:S-adenosylmethionine hydrolase
VVGGTVTVLTDFGTGSRYAGEVRAVLCAPSPGLPVRVVELTHDVRRHDVRQGAAILRSVVGLFPPGTVHLAVVDPGVGTARRGVAVRSGGHLFVGPDNGLLLTAALALGDPEVREITHPDLRRPRVAATFWGRDVFAPCARWLALGFPFDWVGPPVPDPVALAEQPPRREPGRLSGEVVGRDPFGNLATNLPGDWLEGLPEVVVVRVGTREEVARRVRTYGEASVGDLVVLVGSDGFLEVAVREGDAAERLQAGPGSPLVLSFAP